MADLTEAHVEQLRRKVFGAVATLKQDGTPQTSIVWLDTDGENVLFNTRNERAKAKHLRRDPRVTVAVFDPERVYDYFEVEGTAELITEGADEHIQELSRKYTGKDFHTPSGRVIVRIHPRRVFDYSSPAR
ncbi:MAG TPA: PPOX class F420-dependent oxidoreductase [Gaiellaceae bacterium]|nr:PPOX class F420-dependent oxidoreductase [Gaiellaceae bacterium]